jgi:AcrR family transcriptional regulator
MPAATVAASQRERLLRAVVEDDGERGWTETRIADVVATAAVSRRTFYELFDSLEACFIAAVEAGFARLMAAVADRTEVGELDFEGRVRRFFASYLELLETTPGATRALHVEMLRATDGVRALHDRVIEEIGQRLLLARYGDGLAAADVPPGYGVALVGGFEHLLSRQIRAGAGSPADVVADATAIAVRALA